MKKRRYKKKMLPVRLGEVPTKERGGQQGGLTLEVVDRDSNDKVVITRYRSVAECALDAYYIRENISTPQYEAGMRFRKAYLRAVLHVQVDDARSGSHGDPEMAAVVMTESEQYLRAAYHVLTEQEKAVAVSVCGCDDWVGGDYRMQILGVTLSKLAILWNFS